MLVIELKSTGYQGSAGLCDPRVLQKVKGKFYRTTM
jgi:hypothetical protein